MTRRTMVALGKSRCLCKTAHTGWTALWAQRASWSVGVHAERGRRGLRLRGADALRQAVYWNGLPASDAKVVVRPEGIEPPAYRFEACRSIHLSYGRTSKKFKNLVTWRVGQWVNWRFQFTNSPIYQLANSNLNLPLRRRRRRRLGRPGARQRLPWKERVTVGGVVDE
jgi:hypothetical protein